MNIKKEYIILVVDDEAAYIDVLRDILVPAYTVKPAINGASALKMVEKYNPDLILLDAIMPQMSGFEVLDALKTSDHTKNIPVILLSGLTESTDEVKALRLGAVDYIKKPFDKTILELRVKRQLKILAQTRALEQEGLIDALTCLPNKHGATDRLHADWNRSLRKQGSLSILLIGLDGLTNLNDRYGYAGGDEILSMAGNVISQTATRLNGFAARWEGDTFMVLLPDTSHEEAVEMAEQIRQNMENTEIPLVNRQVAQVTVCIGVNSVTPKSMHSDSMYSIESIITAAQDSLRDAKNTGKNNVK